MSVDSECLIFSLMKSAVVKIFSVNAMAALLKAKVLIVILQELEVDHSG